jgi:polyisoprenoid-binding protein YceI
MTTKRRKWPWFLGGGVLLIVIAAIAGPFVYIHFIQADPKPALTFENIDANSGSTTTTAAASSGATTADPPATTAAAGSGAATGSIDGTWKVASGSQAGYRVKEVLFGQSTDAVGRTNSVTGSLTISGTSVTDGSFTVDLTTVTSDESQRDSQFQGRIMNTSQFPNATFKLTKPIDLGSLPGDKTEVNYTATGDLTLHGVTKSVDVPITARRNGANIEVSGTIPVKFSDYQIGNPSSAAATTQDNGVVEFLLVFSQS